MPHADSDLAACPLCGATSLHDRGQIYHASPALVAGIPIDLEGKRFHLIACQTCGYQFKSPEVPESALLECYEKATGGHWGVAPDPHERQFDLIADALERFAPPAFPHGSQAKSRILDVGCFNGALLCHLSDRWQREGVEPSSEAAEVARSRGVAILGPTLDANVPSSSCDAVLAIDVLEHLPKPFPFFREVARVLKPGGIFLAVTGNTQAPSWKFQAARYWYCSLPEHVGFFSRESLSYAAAQTGMESIHQQELSHIRSPWTTRTAESTKNLAWTTLLKIGWLPGKSLKNRLLHRRAPGWISARDHLLHVMRRT